MDMESIATAKVRLNNDCTMPLLGLGTWNANGDDLYNAVTVALDSGYRHIDTAESYENEETIGRAIGDALASGRVQRADLFVTDKLWNTHHRPDLVRDSCQRSLERLGLAYIDMYLMHWPMAFREDASTLWPRDQRQELMASSVDFVQTWRAMQMLVDEGLVRGIGVANFNERQLDRLLMSAGTMPACIQIECHPYLTQTALSDYCAARHIQVVAVCPLGTPNRPDSLTGEPLLFANSLVQELARKLGRTPAQVLLRYQLQRGHSAVVKSMTPKRIISNAEVFCPAFQLTDEQMGALDALNYGRRFITFLGCVDFDEYPFKRSSAIEL